MIINPYAAATPLSGPLDGYAADLWAAWAPYRLLGSFSGAYIRVRRASDNAEADCGSDAEIAAHCGASEGFARTLYDQSGNGRHAVQTTASAQPKIYNGAAVIAQIGGKPSCEFDGSNDHFVCPSMSSSGLSTVDTFAAAKVQNDPASSAATSGPVFWTDTVGGGAANDHHPWVDGNIYIGTFRTVRQSGNPTDALTLAHVLNTTSITGGNFTVRVNSQTLYDGAAGSFSVSSGSGPFIGRSFSGDERSLLGHIGAVLLYSSNKAADRASITAAIT